MKRRMMILAAMAAVVLAVSVACTPKFPVDGTLTAADEAPYVILSWPTAAPFSENDPVTEYGIEVNGVEVSRVEAWASTCVLKGLTNSTTYTLGVTAYDSAGRFSGNAAANGRLTVAHTTASEGDSGSEVFCDTAPPPPDLPGD